MSKRSPNTRGVPPKRVLPWKAKGPFGVEEERELARWRCRWCGAKLKTKRTPRREGNKIYIETTAPVPAYCPNGCTEEES
jgi:hypothetical protein